MKPPSLDDEVWFDRPEAFADAAAAFARVYPQRGLTVEQVAMGLSLVAEGGHIVSGQKHEALLAWYAGQLKQASDAADDLVRRLDGAS